MRTLEDIPRSKARESKARENTRYFVPIGSIFSLISTIFIWVSKVIRDCLAFPLFPSMIGLENSHHFLNQSDSKLKPWRLGHFW